MTNIRAALLLTIPACTQSLETLTCAAGSGPPAVGTVEYLAPIDPPRGDPEVDLYRVTLNDVEAVCNDGTQAVYYVQPGQGEGADKWHIHLLGGFSCGDHQTCHDRWCDSAPIMSSQWTPEIASVAGLLDPAPPFTNPFADWNQVVVYYCGSDMHRGRAGYTVLQKDLFTKLGLWFHGADVVDAVLTDLRSGAVVLDAEGSGEALPGDPVPDLDDASVVLFSGSSAGAAGALHHTDRVRAELLTTNPELRYETLIDGGYVADLATWLADPEEPWRDSFDDATVWHADTDATCLATHVNFTCEDPRVVVTELDSPLFVRQDPGDPVFFGVLNSYAAIAVLPEDFADGMTAALQDLEATVTSGGEPVGVFGPGCVQHVGITHEPASFQHRMEDPPETPSFAETLLDWRTGRALDYAELIDVFAVAEAIAVSDPGSCP